MKFSGYLLLYEDTSAIEFGHYWSIHWVGHASKVGQNELDCSSVCGWDRNFQSCYCYVLFNNLVHAVPKMGHMSKSGTFPKCKVVLVFFLLQTLYSPKKSWCCKITSYSQNETDILKKVIPRMSYFLIVAQLFWHPCLYTLKRVQSYKQWLEETVMEHGSIFACFRPVFFNHPRHNII